MCTCDCCKRPYGHSVAVASEAADALDRHFDSPTWDEKIDMAALNLFSMRHCVLGQLFGHFDSAPKKLTKLEGFHGWVDDEAWRDLIGSRQAVRQPAPVKAEVDGELVGV